MKFSARFATRVAAHFAASWVALILAIPLFAQTAKPSSPPKPVKHAQPTISDIWIKPTIPGGEVTAAYMRIQSASALKLLKVDGTIAGDMQLHDMKMTDGMMEMRALDSVAIPAGQLVELKPGGKHVMMMNVAKAIKAGDQIPLQLTFEDAAKKKFIVRVTAMARAEAPNR